MSDNQSAENIVQIAASPRLGDLLLDPNDERVTIVAPSKRYMQFDIVDKYPTDLPIIAMAVEFGVGAGIVLAAIVGKCM